MRLCLILVSLTMSRLTAADYPLAAPGPFQTTTTEVADFLVYHPVTMAGSSPLLTWSNPAFFDSWSFEKLLRLQASYGMIVVASHSTRTASGDDAIAGVDLMLGENSNPASQFFGKTFFCNARKQVAFVVRFFLNCYGQIFYCF